MATYQCQKEKNTNSRTIDQQLRCSSLLLGLRSTDVTVVSLVSLVFHLFCLAAKRHLLAPSSFTMWLCPRSRPRIFRAAKNEARDPHHVCCVRWILCFRIISFLTLVCGQGAKYLQIVFHLMLKCRRTYVNRRHLAKSSSSLVIILTA